MVRSQYFFTLTISFVQKKVYWPSINDEPISGATFMRYMPRLDEIADHKISDALPNHFELI